MKNIVITGSTRGIGLCMAKEFIKAGCNVTISGRGRKLSEELKKELSGFGTQILYVSCDVRKINEVERLWRRSAGKWGRVDIWINNAGLSGGYQYLQDLPSAEITKIIDVNLKGTVLACKLLISYFNQNEGGTLINLSGRGGKFEIVPYLATYAATKAAVVSLTQSLARENVGKNISINL